MCDFVCDNCDKVFQRKEHLDYHLEHNACRERNFKCIYCNKSFTTNANMRRHARSSCKVKKQNDDEKESILERLLVLEERAKEIELLREKNSSLQKEVSKLKKTKIISVNNTNNLKTINNNSNCTTNINKGTVNNIILVGYGKEDISKLSKTEILKVLQNGYQSTLKLTEAVHFNPRFPEYHNIYISNMKDKYAMMFDGKKWALTMKEDLINQIYEDKKNFIEQNLEEFVDSLTVSRRQALKRWLDTDDEDPKIKEIKENIKLLLYNSRRLVSDDIETNQKKTEASCSAKSRSKKVIKDKCVRAEDD